MSWVGSWSDGSHFAAATASWKGLSHEMEHLKNVKTRRVPYLSLVLKISVKIFAIYLISSPFKGEINELVDDGVALLKLGLKGQFLEQDIQLPTSPSTWQNK